MAKSITDYKNDYDPDPMIRALRAENAAFKRELDELKQSQGQIAVRLEEVKEAIQPIQPLPQVYDIPKDEPIVRSPCVLVCHLTDWHIGQVTRAEFIDDLGEFNLAIAQERINRLGDSLVKKVQVMRSGYQINEVVVIGTGDYVNGEIHEENKLTNEFPAPVQVANAGYLMGEFLSSLAPHFKKVRAHILTHDNHGRLTRKPQAEQGGLNNLSYLVATIAKLSTDPIKNVSVNICPGMSKIVDVGSESYLCFHGHQIRSWGGATLPWYGFAQWLRGEAVARMNLPDDKHFTRLLFGHFHVGQTYPEWNTGGNLTGTTAHDRANVRHCRAHQTSWFVHPKKGEFDFTRWWL